MSQTRKFAAILVSDVVGYSRLAGVDFLENLGSHKGKTGGGRSDEGSLPIFLPPYSPDLNPIEQLFVSLNQLTRKA